MTSEEEAPAPKPVPKKTKSQRKRQRQRRSAAKAESKPQLEPIVEPVAEETTQLSPVRAHKPPMKTASFVEPTPVESFAPMPTMPALSPSKQDVINMFRENRPSPVLRELPKVHDATTLIAVEDMSDNVSDSAPALAAPVYERTVSAGVDKGEVEEKPAAVVKKSSLPRVADMTHEQLAGLMEKSKTKKFQAVAAMILEQGITGEDATGEDAFEIIQEVTGLSKVFIKKLFRELKSHDKTLERNAIGVPSTDGQPW